MTDQQFNLRRKLYFSWVSQHSEITSNKPADYLSSKRMICLHLKTRAVDRLILKFQEKFPIRTSAVGRTLVFTLADNLDLLAKKNVVWQVKVCKML